MNNAEQYITEAIDKLGLTDAADIIDFIDGQFDIELDRDRLGELFNAGTALHARGYRLDAGRFTKAPATTKPPMRQPRQAQQRKQTLGAFLRSRLRAGRVAPEQPRRLDDGGGVLA